MKQKETGNDMIDHEHGRICTCSAYTMYIVNKENKYATDGNIVLRIYMMLL